MSFTHKKIVNKDSTTKKAFLINIMTCSFTECCVCTIKKKSVKTVKSSIQQTLFYILQLAKTW